MIGRRPVHEDPSLLAPAQTLREDRGGGVFVLRSPQPLQPYARCVGEWLEHWSHDTPEALAFVEPARAESGMLTWAQARERVGRVAQGLLDLDLPPGDPVVILSDNSLDHLLLMLAAEHVGRPVCTVSSAYSRMSRDSTKIIGILQTLKPALIYADHAQVYGPVLVAAQEAGLTAVQVLSHGWQSVAGARSMDSLMAAPESPAVMQAFAAITPDTHAKYLLTSGSTGHPKVVINTHRMLCANQQQIAQALKFLELERPVIVDWLPWSHTFGGNHNLHIVMRNGGTLVIDEGRPAPGLVEKSLANLVRWQPTLYFNVPRGLDLLLPLLEADRGAAERFLARLRMVFYAGAALPQATWERLQALARAVLGHEVWLTTSWGSTETAPAVTMAHFRLERAGNIGVPLPGLELKFLPSGDKLEMRVRGVSVFPGYRGAPEITARSFDEEGYYCIGDAGLPVDPQRPERGVLFNGRVAEDFKLTTGTWVSVGTLRVRLVSALAPWVQDAVITGHDRDEVGALLFPSAAGAALAPEAFAERVRGVLQALKAEGGGSSQVPVRVMALSEPPSTEGGEITDKGYLNQRAVLARRAADVQALYAAAPGTITLSKAT